MPESAKTAVQQNKRPARGVLKAVGNTAFAVLMIVCLLLAAYIMQLKILGEDNAILKFKMFIVLSGSMSPEFEPGSVVLVQDVKPEEIGVGDILTFRPSAASENIVTHRVASLSFDDGMEITTKGDANNVQDPLPIRPENVIGRVFLSIPYLGYLLNFAGTNYGLYSLIILPSLAVMIYEFFKIVFYIRQGKKDQEASEPVPVLPVSGQLAYVTDQPLYTSGKELRPADTRNGRAYAGSENVFNTFKMIRTLEEVSAVEKELEAFKNEVNSVRTEAKREKLMDCRNSLQLLLEEF